MKTFILLSLLTASAQAADYNCLSGRYKYELNTDPDFYSLTIRNFSSREVLYSGVAAEVIKDDEFSDLVFEMSAHQHLELRFKTEALKEEAAVLYGLSQGFFGMSAFKCYKTELGSRL